MPTYPLYGGAISTTLPSNLLDASQIREIPDTQEVFILEKGDDAKLDQSIIFDILEEIENVDGNIQKKLKTHAEEIGDIRDDTISAYKTIHNKHMGLDCYFVFFVQNSPKKDKYALITMMSLIELKKVDTDVIISLNVPVLQSEEDLLELENLECEISNPASALGKSYTMLQAATSDYYVRDWSLFG